MSALEQQVMSEAAHALGRLGRAVEGALERLRAAEPAADPARRTALLYACADAVWHYFVQREVSGLRDHAPVIEAYGIPAEVLARVGGAPPEGIAPRGRGEPPTAGGGRAR